MRFKVLIRYTMEELTCVARVQTSAQDQRLKDDHPERSRQHRGNDMPYICFLKLNGCHDGLVTRLFAELLRLRLQDNRCICFREDEDKGPSCSGDDDADPESPAPGDGSDVTGDGGSLVSLSILHHGLVRRIGSYTDGA